MIIIDRAIRHHFQKDIIERIELTGGYTFKTWLLILSGGEKVVFRTQADFVTGGGRKIIIAEVFEREKFFYDIINMEIGRVCPEVYVIDGTCRYYENAFQVSEYIEGTALGLSCFNNFDKQTQDSIFYKIGGLAAKIGKIEIDHNHPYIKQRGPWGEFISQRLYERLMALEKSGFITHCEIEGITNDLRGKKANNAFSFIHLDMRLENMIYNNNHIFLVDAENCEFGDHLLDLTVIDINYGFTESFLKGYESVAGVYPDTECELYLYYKLERLALILYVYANEIVTDKESTQMFLSMFQIIKDKLAASNKKTGI